MSSGDLRSLGGLGISAFRASGSSGVLSKLKVFRAFGLGFTVLPRIGRVQLLSSKPILLVAEG